MSYFDEENEFAIDDPKLKAMMKKLKKNAQNSVKQEATTKPPKSFEEYLAIEHVSEWPERLTSEKPNVDETRSTIGTAEDFLLELRQAIFNDFTIVNSLEERLESLESSLSTYNELLFETSKRKIGRKLSPHSLVLQQQQQQETSPTTAAISFHDIHHTAEKELVDQILDSERKTVRNCSFPGFFPRELNNFPEQLEATTILRRVTNAQEFSTSFLKMWKKVFLSEAAIAILHDSFWWLFIENFDKDKKEEQSLLFDRISYSYVSLFQCVHSEIRDKIFALHTFPSCLAQGVYSIFLESFPESYELFGGDFKQQIANTIYEWTTGVRAPPGIWRNWKEDLLKAQASTINKQAEPSVTQLLKEGKIAQSDIAKCLNIGGMADLLDSIDTKTNLLPLLTQIAEQLPMKSPLGRKPLSLSCTVGHGALRELVTMNSKGQVPLVAHFLYIHQLQNTTQPSGMKLLRTETITEDTVGTTYKDIVQASREVTQHIVEEHKRDEEATTAAILEIRRQQREANEAIEKLKKEIMFNKNALEIKKLAEQLQIAREEKLAANLGKKKKENKEGEEEEEEETESSSLNSKDA